MRQRPNFRRYARGRPQRPQRLYFRTLNFGVRFDFSINAFFAMSFLGRRGAAAPVPSVYFLRNGIPIWVRSSIASSSVLADVTIVMSIPRTFATLS